MKPLASIAFVALALAGLFLLLRTGEASAAFALAPASSASAPAREGSSPTLPQSQVVEQDSESELALERGPEAAPVRTELMRTIHVKALVLSESTIRAKRVPHVWVDFGVGSAFDRELDAESQLLAARGKSDAAGRIDVEFDVPAGFDHDGGALVVFGLLGGAGFQRSVSMMPIADVGDVEIELTLIATPGGTVSGRLVDAEGRSVVSSVALMEIVPGVTDESRQLRNIAQMDAADIAKTVNSQGQFTFNYGGAGRFRVMAADHALGTAVGKELLLDGRESVDGIVLTLEGPGHLFGRVVDLEGAPIKDLNLTVRQVPVESESPAGGGFHQLTGPTDSDGRFDFPALSLGPFEILGSRNWVGNDFRFGSQSKWQLTPVPVSSITGELELVLDERFLELTVVDAHGESVLVEAGLPLWLEGSEVRAYVFPCTPSGRMLSPEKGEVLTGRHGHDRTLSFEVQAGQNYLVGAFSLSTGVHEEVIQIGSRRTRTRQTVFLGPALEEGTLHLKLQDDDGKLFEGRNKVVIQAPMSGAELFVSKWRSTQAEYAIPLPPGEFEVTVKGETSLDLGDLTSASTWFGESWALSGGQRFRVSAGTVTELSLVVPPAESRH